MEASRLITLADIEAARAFCRPGPKFAARMRGEMPFMVQGLAKENEAHALVSSDMVREAREWGDPEAILVAWAYTFFSRADFVVDARGLGFVNVRSRILGPRY